MNYYYTIKKNSGLKQNLFIASSDSYIKRVLLSSLFVFSLIVLFYLFLILIPIPFQKDYVQFCSGDICMKLDRKYL